MTVQTIIDEELANIRPEKDTIKKIKEISGKFISELEKKLKSKKINAQVFIGGSLAKNTIIKKDKYDVDIFVRFPKEYSGKNISEILEKLLPDGFDKIHGSRDYFQHKEEGIILEVIPVIKIRDPKEAFNVTDLSYFHVNYVSGKIKSDPRLSDEIILTKAFCHACDCYGAESYIHGFSGYSIELLITHYKTFKRFIKEIAESKDGEKIIIDDMKHYKTRQEVLREMNEAKLLNPIILVDPTFKERNALASLSNETYKKFKAHCKNFLDNPTNEYFHIKNINEEMSRLKDVRVVSIKTTKQKGDISGTKSKKFYCFFSRESSKEFSIKKTEFFYDDKKNIAYMYFVLGKKEDETIKGPPVTQLEGLTAFKKRHTDAFIKDDHAYINVKHDSSFEEFFKKFSIQYKQIMKEMAIKEIKLEK